jgi:hypothetical protein
MKIGETIIAPRKLKLALTRSWGFPAALPDFRLRNHTSGRGHEAID